MTFNDVNTYLLYFKDNLIGRIVEPSIGVAFKMGRLDPTIEFGTVKEFVDEYLNCWRLYKDTDDWLRWESNYENMKNEFGEDFLVDENWKLFSTANNKQFEMSIPLIDTMDNSITWKF